MQPQVTDLLAAADQRRSVLYEAPDIQCTRVSPVLQNNALNLLLNKKESVPHIENHDEPEVCPLLPQTAYF